MDSLKRESLNKLTILIISLLCISGLAYATTHVYDDYNFHDNNVLNATQINATEFFQGVNKVLDQATSFSGEISGTFNSITIDNSALDDQYLTDEEEGDLNTNSSDYWDGKDVPSDIAINELDQTGEGNLNVNQSDYWGQYLTSDEWIGPNQIADVDKSDIEGDVNTFLDVDGDTAVAGSSFDMAQSSVSNVDEFNTVKYVEAGNGSDIQATLDTCSESDCEVVVPKGNYSISDTIYMGGFDCANAPDPECVVSKLKFREGAILKPQGDFDAIKINQTGILEGVEVRTSHLDSYTSSAVLLANGISTDEPVFISDLMYNGDENTSTLDSAIEYNAIGSGTHVYFTRADTIHIDSAGAGLLFNATTDSSNINGNLVTNLIMDDGGYAIKSVTDENIMRSNRFTNIQWETGGAEPDIPEGIIDFVGSKNYISGTLFDIDDGQAFNVSGTDNFAVGSFSTVGEFAGFGINKVGGSIFGNQNIEVNDDVNISVLQSSDGTISVNSDLVVGTSRIKGNEGGLDFDAFSGNTALNANSGGNLYLRPDAANVEGIRITSAGRVDIMAGPLDLTDKNIDNIASMDGGGDAIVSNDNLDMNSNAINNSAVLELDTTTLPICDSTTEGEIRYNGTHHLGCDGSSWNSMY